MLVALRLLLLCSVAAGVAPGQVAGLIIESSCPLPNAQPNVAYNHQLQVAGGAPPYSWSLAGGALPPNFGLSSAGLISGTTAATGTFNFILLVADARQNAATKGCSLTVSAAPSGQHFISSLSPDSALAGSGPLNVDINGFGFSQGAVFVWNAESPERVELPTIFLSPVLLRTTVPANLLADRGIFLVAVRQMVLTAPVFSNVVEFRVAAPITISTPCPLVDGVLRAPYSQRFAATGGFSPFTWRLRQGRLPSGVGLSATGEISGVPTEAGVFNFTVEAVDARGNTAAKDCRLRILGPLTVSPLSVEFIANAGGAPPDPRLLAITSLVPGTSFQFLITSLSGGPWLQAEVTSRNTPARMRLTALSAALAPAVYQAQVVITSEESLNRTVTIPVRLTVNPAQPPGLTWLNRLFFMAPRNGAPQLRSAPLLSRSGPVIFSVSASTETGDWLSVAPASGTVTPADPVNLRARVVPGNQPTGIHRGRVRISSSAGNLEIPVVLAVGSALESMILSQTGFTFVAVQGGPAPPPQQFLVLAGGNTGFFWEAAVSTLSGGNWARVDPGSNASRPGGPSGARILVDPAGLAPDVYSAEVRVSSASIDNSPRLIRVDLHVLPPGASPGLLLEPAALVFLTSPAGPNPARQSIFVRNLSRSALDIDFLFNGDARIWNVSSPDDRGITAGQTRRIDIGVNASALAAGVYRASIAVQSAADSTVPLAELLLIVAPGQPATATAGSARQAAGCTPGRLLPVSTLQPTGFTAPGGLPVPLELRVHDDCGDPMTSGAVTASFSDNLPGPVSLVHLGDGRWSGTWQVQQTTNTPVTVTVRAEDPVRNLAGSLQLTGDVTANAGIPVIPEDGIVSAASFAAGSPLAPGSLLAIFGSRLADGRFTPAGLPLPSLLGATRVAIAGREAPLFFAGDLTTFSQVNAMLPYDLPVNTVHQVSVRRGTRRSNFAEVLLAPAQPAIFSVSQTGGGQGVVVDGANPLVVADASNPVSRGGVIVIYCEGLGAVNQPVVAGQAVPASPLSQANAPVTVTVGGQPAQVLFAGLTPFFTGLYQVNAVVPDNIAPGNAVPVVITAGGQPSQTVTIAVR